jgi:predicted ATPase
LWKAASDAPGTIETRLARAAQGALRYQLSFTAAGAHTEIVDEIIEDAVQVDPEASGPYFYYQFRGGRPTLNVRGEGDAEPRPRTLPPESLAVDESVLSQRKDPETYPELSWCASQFARIQTFREWSFGRYSAVRQPQPADLPADVLLPDARNLGLLLNQLEHGDAASELNALVRRFLPRFKRVTTLVQAGTVQFFLHEDGLKKPVPAARLSDGTLRFLAMTALLVMPTPPPLICIEEPELSGSTPTRLRSWPSSSSRRAPERRSS